MLRQKTNTPIPASDCSILRDLARRLAEIASEPVQTERADLWRRLNGLERVRPLVHWHMEDLCWPEVLPENSLRCEHETARDYERWLRRQLWLSELGDDTVFEARVSYQTVVGNTGLGVAAQAERPGARAGEAAHWRPVLVEEADIEKIRMPEVWIDEDETERNREICHELFDGILHPVTRTRNGYDFPGISLMDELATLRGIQQMYMDLIERPRWVHAVLERMLRAYQSMLDQYEHLGLLSLNNGANEIGTSALGFTDELPQPDFDGSNVRPRDTWGFSAAQIFCNVSPAMHGEFVTVYDRRYLANFGLNVIGCCEPLERKMDLVRTVPRVRVVSMSEWVDRERASETLGRDFVFAYKPTGTFFASEHWDLEAARQDLADLLRKTRGNNVEIHHNACSTCLGQPDRIRQWVRVAMRLAQENA